MKTKTVLMAVRVPRYLADAIGEFTKRNEIEPAPFMRYALDMALGNLDKWSEGDKSKVQNLLRVREVQLAVNQARADETAVKATIADRVYKEMTADIRVGTPITGPVKKSKK